MADNKINVLVGANIGPLTDGLKNAAVQLEQSGEAMAKTAQQVTTKTATSYKSLQQAYRATYKDAQILAQQQGTNSAAFREAAAAAANYKDELEDVQDAIKAASSEQRWKLLGTAMAGAVDVAQGYVGAMSLLGIESENANETIKKLLALQGISNAINGIITLTDSMAALNTVAITANLTFGALVGKLLLIAAVAKTIKEALTGSLGTGDTTGAFSLDQAGLMAKFKEINEKIKLEAKNKPIKIEVKPVIENGDAFSTVTIALKKHLLETNSLIKEMPNNMTFFIQKTGEELNKLGIFFDELGNKIGGWSEIFANAIGDVGYAAGQALVGAGDFGKDVLSIIGSIAGQLGSALIAIGTALASNPVTLSMGLLAIGSGVALKVVSGALGGMSAGGTTSGYGTSNQAGYSGSFNSGFINSSQFLDVSGVVRGNNVVIMLDNQNRSNRRVR